MLVSGNVLHIIFIVFFTYRAVAVYSFSRFRYHLNNVRITIYSLGVYLKLSLTFSLWVAKSRASESYTWKMGLTKQAV